MLLSFFSAQAKARGCRYKQRKLHSCDSMPENLLQLLAVPLQLYLLHINLGHAV